jgi:hypothetical protein
LISPRPRASNLKLFVHYYKYHRFDMIQIKGHSQVVLSLARQPMIWRSVADLVGLEAGEADRITWMDCVGCGSASVTERREVTAQGYRRFRCLDCGRRFNERSSGVLNRTSA